MSREANNPEELFADPNEIIAFAQAYYATEHPNSERRACPPIQTLRQVACSSALPDARLRDHLFNCSDCFRSFRSARISYHPQAVSKERRQAVWIEPLRSFFTSKRALLGASAMSVLLLITVAVFVRLARVEPMNSAMNAQPRVAVAPTVQVMTPSETTPAARDEASPAALQGTDARRPQYLQSQRTRRSAPTSRTASNLRVIEINLREEDLLRDADSVGSKPRLISLTARRQRLRLRLPEGSAGGHYAVSVVDAFGKMLVTTSAISNGKTLTVYLDLRSLAAKKYRLCIARDGEAPDCYLVSVSERTSHYVK
ncbi:MAG TPA: hypothetical protein VF779_08080 [Pyrinomonadaceae bacterium]